MEIKGNKKIVAIQFHPLYMSRIHMDLSNKELNEYSKIWILYALFIQYNVHLTVDICCSFGMYISGPEVFCLLSYTLCALSCLSEFWTNNSRFNPHLS